MAVKSIVILFWSIECIHSIGVTQTVVWVYTEGEVNVAINSPNALKQGYNCVTILHARLLTCHLNKGSTNSRLRQMFTIYSAIMHVTFSSLTQSDTIAKVIAGQRSQVKKFYISLTVEVINMNLLHGVLRKHSGHNILPSSWFQWRLNIIKMNSMPRQHTPEPMVLSMWSGRMWWCEGGEIKRMIYTMCITHHINSVT